MGRATGDGVGAIVPGGNFYPRPPWGGRPGVVRCVHRQTFYFYPRPPWGGRPCLHRAVRADSNFYPRPPWGGRQTWFRLWTAACQFLSTPSVGRATCDRQRVRPLQPISIHALRGEGDWYRVVSVFIRMVFLSTPSVGRATAAALCTGTLPQHFYPRPPWGGRPGHWQGVPHGIVDFYPRPPWGGRLVHAGAHLQGQNFYPRPPWGGRLHADGHTVHDFDISIHALRGEGDPGRGLCATRTRISIHALRGEGDAKGDGWHCMTAAISIHALRGEGDRWAPRERNDLLYFYPRPPWGGRLQTVLLGVADDLFLSTPSVGRATPARLGGLYVAEISIHALRGEGDCRRRDPAAGSQNFYPRPPWGGRQLPTERSVHNAEFLSTPSVGRATCAVRISAW